MGEDMRITGLLVGLAMVVTVSSGPSFSEDAAKKPPNFGCPDPHYDELNFWVGRWSVAGPKGKHAGDSEIQSLAEGCVIFESWTGASGVSGNSINVYDQADGKWHQTWVDATGDQVHFIGSFEKGKMNLVADDVSTPDKKKALIGMTLEPLADGRVRQVGTISADGGKTWEQQYELFYTRKP